MSKFSLQAIALIPTMTIGMRWFPHNKGMAMGVVVGGFGGGAFIFNQIQTAILNPDNTSPQVSSAVYQLIFTQIKCTTIYFWSQCHHNLYFDLLKYRYFEMECNFEIILFSRVNTSLTRSCWIRCQD